MREHTEGRAKAGTRRLQAESPRPVLRDGSHVDEALEAPGAPVARTVIEGGAANAGGVVANAVVDAVRTQTIEIEVGEDDEEIVEIPVGLDELAGDGMAGRGVQLAVHVFGVVVGAVVLEDGDVTFVVDESRPALRKDSGRDRECDRDSG